MSKINFDASLLVIRTAVADAAAKADAEEVRSLALERYETFLRLQFGISHLGEFSDQDALSAVEVAKTGILLRRENADWRGVVHDAGELLDSDKFKGAREYIVALPGRPPSEPREIPKPGKPVPPRPGRPASTPGTIPAPRRNWRSED